MKDPRELERVLARTATENPTAKGNCMLLLSEGELCKQQEVARGLNGRAIQRMEELQSVPAAGDRWSLCCQEKESSSVLATAVQEQAGSSNCGTSQAMGGGLCAGN